MNNYLHPIKDLESTISEPKGMDFSATRFLLGYLNSREVRVVRIPYSVDKDADFGVKEIEITAKYSILASKIEKRELVKSLKMVVGGDFRNCRFEQTGCVSRGKRCEA